jgi:uncharacterized protein YqcC (DUF446 family)
VVAVRVAEVPIKRHDYEIDSLSFSLSPFMMSSLEHQNRHQWYSEPDRASVINKTQPVPNIIVIYPIAPF